MRGNLATIKPCLTKYVYTWLIEYFNLQNSPITNSNARVYTGEFQTSVTISCGLWLNHRKILHPYRIPGTIPILNLEKKSLKSKGQYQGRN